MNKQTRSFLNSLICKTLLAGIACLSLCELEAEARRAYSYADMYSPQTTEVEVVKPKKKPRKPKSKPISVRVQKPIDRTSEIETPVSDLTIQKKETPKENKPFVQPLKAKDAEPKQSVTAQIPEKKNSPDLDKAKRITLEELLGADVVKGMSSR